MAAAQRPDVHGVPGSLVGLQPVGPRANRHGGDADAHGYAQNYGDGGMDAKDSPNARGGGGGGGGGGKGWSRLDDDADEML